MYLDKGFIVGLCTIVLVMFACKDDPYNSIDSNQDQAAGPEQVIGKPPFSVDHYQRNFRTHLKGRNEVPPVETNAQGQAIFKVNSDGTAIQYKLIVANIDNVLMSHIHNAPAGQNGGIVVWLYPSSPPPQLIEGRFQGVLAEGTITADDLVGSLEGEPLGALIEEMKAGNTYVNVHTTEHPPGEVRGQIR